MTPLASKQAALRPLGNITPQQVLERYLNEETSTQIAASLGVTRAALSYHMLKHAEQEWKDAQLVKAMKRKEDADHLLERADNALDIARARELLKSAQWDLERVCRRIFGQDTPPAHAASITINLGFKPQDVVVEGQVIEHNPSDKE